MKWKNIIPHPGTQLDAREAHKAKNHGPNWVLQEIEITNQKKESSYYGVGHQFFFALKMNIQENTVPKSP